MTIRVVIVGPGRVGAAFGRRFVEGGLALLGFVGRDPERAAAAARFAGAGAALPPAGHAAADCVVFAVGDGDLAAAVARCLAVAPPRAGAVWLHTSGCHDLAVLDAAAAFGALRGALHPVAPFADAEAGLAAMPGRPAVITGDPGALPVLERLVAALGMRGLRAGDGDRALYHAACALAANGLVVLRGLVDDAFAAAGGLAPADARAVADALMTAALEGVAARGAVAALSGPVRRGDAATVARHVRTLQQRVGHAEDVYRALMRGALRLAAQAGLPSDAAAAVREVLERAAGAR